MKHTAVAGLRSSSPTPHLLLLDHKTVEVGPRGSNGRTDTVRAWKTWVRLPLDAFGLFFPKRNLISVVEIVRACMTSEKNNLFDRDFQTIVIVDAVWEEVLKVMIRLSITKCTPYPVGERFMIHDT